MEPKKEGLALAGICAVAVLLSLAGLASVFFTGMGLSLDAIFLVLVCLMMGGLFTLMLLLQLKTAGFLPPLKWPRREKSAVAEAASAKEEAK
jgi:hypothetical protein